MISKTGTRSAGTPRRGITLLETLILMTCIAIVLGLAAVTIQVMLRVTGESQVRLSSSLMFERLARQLRADAHSSETALLEDAKGKALAEGPELKFAPEPGRVVVYKILQKSVDRDETLSGKRVRHESFVLPRGREAKFVLGGLAGRASVSLVVEPGSQSVKGGSPRGLEVFAVVGKHRGWPTEKSKGPAQ